MNDSRTKETVSISDLRKAIEDIPIQPAPHDHLRLWVAFIDAREKAWRAAYMWRVGFTERWRAQDVLDRELDRDRWVAEEENGTALIREHLV